MSLLLTVTSAPLTMTFRSPIPDSHELDGDPASGVDFGLGLDERCGLKSGAGERQSEEASGEEQAVPGRHTRRQRAEYHTLLGECGETAGTGGMGKGAVNCTRLCWYYPFELRLFL